MRLVREDGGDADGALLRDFEQCLALKGPDLFEPDRPITVARGPARMDCMGGIADYSGSVVFEAPLRRAAVVAFQPGEGTTLRAYSAAMEAAGTPAEATADLSAMRGPDGGSKSYEELNALLTANPGTAWAAYVLGAVPVLEREAGHRFAFGGTFLVWSDVPIGVGVASSAAVEVASMYALAAHFGLEIPGPRFAAMAQSVENKVVGAPCGIMDQVTCALGEAGKLLALRCQPCELLGQHELPEGVKVLGLSSRVEHRVGGAAYAAARVSAFMGLKVILREKELRGQTIAERDGYLCNLPPQEYLSDYRRLLPEQMTGRQFLDAYGATTDPVTTVDPGATYRVRAGADHPVFENQRVVRFIECMGRARRGDRTALVEAGGLMYASHWSYSWNAGLGCEETDLLVRLVRQRGAESGLYGAKVTGGGSGGTVAVLAEADAEEAVHGVAAEYESRTGLAPDVFDGSSPGAFDFGPRRYRFERE